MRWEAASLSQEDEEEGKHSPPPELWKPLGMKTQSGHSQGTERSPRRWGLPSSFRRGLGASGQGHLRSKAALSKTVHSLVKVFAAGCGQLPQPSPKQRFGERR